MFCSLSLLSGAEINDGNVFLSQLIPTHPIHRSLPVVGYLHGNLTSNEYRMLTFFSIRTIKRQAYDDYGSIPTVTVLFQNVAC